MTPVSLRDTPGGYIVRIVNGQHATAPAVAPDHEHHHDIGPDRHGGHSGHGGHDGHAGHDPAMFRRRFWLSLLLTVPLVVTSESVMGWFRYDLDVPAAAWWGPVLGSVVFWWGGWPFLAGGAAEIRSRRPGMMLLITMAITVAYAASMATSVGWLDLEFWWELAALVTIMLLGHWQEMKAIGQARNALAALSELLPDSAEVVDGDVRPLRRPGRPAHRRHRAGPPGVPGPGRWRGRRRRRRARRVDDHRRVATRRQGRRGPRGRRHGVDRLVDPGAGAGRR